MASLGLEVFLATHRTAAICPLVLKHLEYLDFTRKELQELHMHKHTHTHEHIRIDTYHIMTCTHARKHTIIISGQKLTVKSHSSGVFSTIGTTNSS